MGNFLASWKTSLAGILVLACTGTTYSDMLPPKYAGLLQLVCGVLIGFGIIAAKDANVTNAPTAVQPHVTPAVSVLPPPPPQG